MTERNYLAYETGVMADKSKTTSPARLDPGRAGISYLMKLRRLGCFLVLSETTRREET